MNIGTFSNFFGNFWNNRATRFWNILFSQEKSRVITTPSLCSTTVKQVNRLLADFLDQDPAAIWPSMLLTFVFQHSCSLWMSDWDKKENTKNSFHFLLNQLDVMLLYNKAKLESRCCCCCFQAVEAWRAASIYYIKVNTV